MLANIEERIEKAHGLILRSIPGNMKVDSLSVAKQVEEYRQFWKPAKTSVILLAESHVYTDEVDNAIMLNKAILNRIVQGYLSHFVRFVYCLGYGESELLDKVRYDRKNTGTPQYWKIFSSSIAENEIDLGFRRILKMGRSSLQARLRNKVDILTKMREKGVWLLDASIVGLYGSGEKNHMAYKKILEICWKNYLADTILESEPKHIIVIGKGVEGVLRSKLRSLNISSTVVPQPQARGDSEWQLENYRTYQRICAKYC